MVGSLRIFGASRGVERNVMKNIHPPNYTYPRHSRYGLAHGGLPSAGGFLYHEKEPFNEERIWELYNQGAIIKELMLIFSCKKSEISKTIQKKLKDDDIPMHIKLLQSLQTQCKNEGFRTCLISRQGLLFFNGLPISLNVRFTSDQKHILIQVLKGSTKFGAKRYHTHAVELDLLNPSFDPQTIFDKIIKTAKIARDMDKIWA